jgi:hypothetical protein
MPTPRKPDRKVKKGTKSKTRTKAASTKQGFPQAFAKLLRSRDLPVPRGLSTAPPDAYANQPATLVDSLRDLGDEDLRRYADRVAGYAARQADRARGEWESSPLIAELRRRGLPEPAQPKRAAGVSVALGKPLSEWTDGELVDAAREWSRRARG